MIEGPEAAKRFENTLTTVLFVPTSAAPNPFGQAGKKEDGMIRLRTLMW
jgi:hypothetical protein